MDRPIRRLPEVVIGRVAAGEVVERPSSVLKELVENALDAGGTEIHMSFRRAGKDSIAVSDNGSGMGPEDVPMAVERHATSKIECFEDLDRIGTFGFRGEALPSIGSVSRLTIRTRRAADELGTELVVDDGIPKGKRPCAMASGTTVRVEHLFQSVPARRKFLKTDQTESNHMVEVARLFALARPDVAFRMRRDGRDVFSAAAGERLGRIRQLWGSCIGDTLQQFSFAGDEIRGEAFTSGQHMPAELTRSQMIFFVNGRCVRSNDLSSWMGEAFAKFFTKKRPLHCFLFLIIPQSQIDINVHPAKMEVRFSRRAALRELLLHAFGEHFASLGKSIWSAPPAETDLHSKNFCGSSEEFGCPEEFSKNGGAMDVNWGQPAPQGVKTSSRGPKAMGWRYVAMFDRRCALLSSGNGIVFFDVGAAAAHLADKKLRKEISAAGNRQRLLAPIAIDLSAAGGGSEKLDGKIRELGEMGFSAAKAGEESISVAEIPQWLDGRRCEMFIWRWLSGNGSGHPCDAEVAKAAVGGETQLSPWGESEVLNLLDALLSDGDAPPHLYFEISRGEVARRLANFGNCQIHGVLGD